jgi:hypothetical protein
MTPLEAVARALFETEFPWRKWESRNALDVRVSTNKARAAILALADNVSENMIEECEANAWSWGDGLIKGIRSAADE